MKHRNRGLWAGLAGCALLLAACASGPKKAEDSAIALAKNVVLESVPAGGVAIQALVGAGGVEDRGSYKIHSQQFCQTNAEALARARTNFAELCKVKGAQFDGQYCLRNADSDDVLFAIQLEPRGSNCYRMHASEAVTVGSPDYTKFLGTRGYITADVRVITKITKEAAAAEARQRALAEQQAKQALELARVERELPQLRKRGARVCLVDSGPYVYRGYVEDFSDEKLKIAVAEAFMPNSPGIRPGGFQPNTLWDYPIRWRIC